MMCFPSIDSLVKKVDSKYTLVTLAADRARELTDGQPPLIPDAPIKPPSGLIGISIFVFRRTLRKQDFREGFVNV